MVVIIIAAVLVAGIAFYQIVQGLFSALIMAALTILTALVAFNFYEPLASLLYTRQPAYADAAALIVMFFIPLLVLRIFADKFIKTNVVFSPWADRIAGGALGLLTGTILVGVLMTATQMLPWGQTILGYRPYNDAMQREQRLVPFYPDKFVASLAGITSAGAFSGENNFSKAHADLALESFCARNTAGLNGRVDALPNVLTVKGFIKNVPLANKKIEDVDVPRDPCLAVDEPTKPVTILITVDASARGKDNWWRLVGTHFRLVCQNGRSCYPVAFLASDGTFYPAETKNGLAQVAKLAVVRQCHENEEFIPLACVYQLRDSDKPDYMVFRRVAGAAVGPVELTPDRFREVMSVPASSASQD